MGTFTAILVPYFKPCEGCDYGNKTLHLPFQSRNVVKFSSPFAVRFFCFKKSFYIVNLYLHLISVVRSVLVMTFISYFRKSVLLVSVTMKSR